MKLLDLLDHGVEALAQVADLVFLVSLEAYGKVPLFRLFHEGPQRNDRRVIDPWNKCKSSPWYPSDAPETVIEYPLKLEDSTGCHPFLMCAGMVGARLHPEHKVSVEYAYLLKKAPEVIKIADPNHWKTPGEFAKITIGDVPIVDCVPGVMETYAKRNKTILGRPVCITIPTKLPSVDLRFDVITQRDDGIIGNVHISSPNNKLVVECVNFSFNPKFLEFHLTSPYRTVLHTY